MLLFVDSFAHYTQPFMDKKWDVVTTPSAIDNATPPVSPTIVQGVATGRFGGGGVTFDTPAASQLDAAVSHIPDPQYIQRNYNGVSIIHVGMAVLQLATQLTVGGRLLTFLDGATTQVGIDIMPSGQLRAVRSTLAGTGIYLGSPAATSSTPKYTVLGTSTSAIASSSFDFLEFKITHHPTTGSVEILRNGAAFWLLENVNTAISTSNTSSSVLVGGYSAVFTSTGGILENHCLQATVSDFHLLNTTAGGTGDPVTFIGDRHWEPLFPLADATYTEWTPDPAVAHFENIDEVPPDDGTTNNNTDTLNDRDSFEFESALGPGSATLMFSYTMYVEKDSGGSVGISGLSRSPAGGGGTDSNGTEVDVPSPYAFRQSFGFIDPDSTTAWTVDSFNAAEHGYQRTS